MTTENSPTFVCEVATPADGNKIVELVGALMQAKEALQKHTAIDGPEFKAWSRANRVLTRIFAPLNGPTIDRVTKALTEGRDP